MVDMQVIGRLAAGRRAAWVAGLGADVGVFCGPRWRLGWRWLLQGPPVVACGELVLTVV